MTEPRGWQLGSSTSPQPTTTPWRCAERPTRTITAPSRPRTPALIDRHAIDSKLRGTYSCSPLFIPTFFRFISSFLPSRAKPHRAVIEGVALKLVESIDADDAVYIVAGG